MRAFLAWLAVLAVTALAGFIVFELWNTDWRWRPHTIDKHQAMIAQIAGPVGLGLAASRPDRSSM